MSKKEVTEAKPWSKPELTVLTRNNPEEMVLADCKGSGNVLPVGVYGNCYNILPPSSCGACTSIGVS